MAFSCRTALSCDNCGAEIATAGERMPDCASRQWLELSAKGNGWIKILGKYNICKECAEHYDRNYLYVKMRKTEEPAL